MVQANDNQKKVVKPYTYQAKIDFKPKKVTRDKNGQYLMITGIIHQEVHLCHSPSGCFSKMYYKYKEKDLLSPQLIPLPRNIFNHSLPIVGEV